MRTGGTAKALRALNLWILIITVLGLFGFSKILQIKENYTTLHARVNQLEREVRLWTKH